MKRRKRRAPRPSTPRWFSSSSGSCLLRQGSMRGGPAAFSFQSFEGCSRSFWRRPPFSAALSLPIGPSCASARLFGDTPAAWGRQPHTRSTSFGQANSDGLFRGARAVLAPADVMHFFTNEFACLRAGGFCLRLAAARPCNGSLFWHNQPFQFGYLTENSGSLLQPLHHYNRFSRFFIFYSAISR